MNRLITERLRQIAEPEYREFAQRLTPDGKPLLGVRMGAIRILAKELAKTNCWDVESLGDPHEDQFHEEKLVRFLAIAYAPMEEQNRIVFLDQMLDYIDNWALCDSLSNTLKRVAKYPYEYRAFIEQHIHDRRPYASRLAIVLLLNHFMTSDWIPENLLLLEQVNREHYYIRMAVAWAVATAFSVSPNVVLKWLESKPLNIETARMAAQKIRDSRRVSKEEKVQVTELIRNTW